EIVRSWWVMAGEAKQVVAGEVLGAVEGSRRRRSTAVPKGSRVSADGAESGRPKPGEVERTEAAHRNAADRHAALVGASSAQRCRDRFGQNLSSPRTIPPVVPVAVVA